MSQPTHFNEVLDALVRRVELGDDPATAQMLIAAADYFATKFPGLQAFNGMPTAHDSFGRIEAAKAVFKRNARRMARQEAATSRPIPIPSSREETVDG